jgi:hypothetical protein
VVLESLHECVASFDPLLPLILHHKQVVLESLRDLCRLPWFFAELFANYDCNPEASDLLTNLLTVSHLYIHFDFSFKSIYASMLIDKTL